VGAGTGAQAQLTSGARGVSARVREALSVVRAIRSESDGGDQTRGKQMATGGAAPLRGGEVVGVEVGAS
jgi:hypothetical protein